MTNSHLIGGARLVPARIIVAQRSHRSIEAKRGQSQTERDWNFVDVLVRLYQHGRRAYEFDSDPDSSRSGC